VQHRPQDDDAADRLAVEALGQHHAVGEDLHLAGIEAADQVAVPLDGVLVMRLAVRLIVAEGRVGTTEEAGDVAGIGPRPERNHVDGDVLDRQKARFGVKDKDA
jgi:hypothetical protein